MCFILWTAKFPEGNKRPQILWRRPNSFVERPNERRLHWPGQQAVDSSQYIKQFVFLQILANLATVIIENGLDPATLPDADTGFRWQG